MSKVSLAKDKIKILLLEGVHQSAVETLKRNGYSNIDYVKTSLPEDELKERIKDVHFVGLRSRTHINQAVLDSAEKLVAIGCFCIGTNQVDLDAARERGIPERNAAAHRGGWLKTANGSFEARGKTLGIIGYGHIGTQLGIMAENIGMNVEFYDIEDKLSLGNATQVHNLTQLLQRSDIISLHVPETPQTKNLIGTAELAVMKQGSILINASRGTVVDIDALAEALTEKKLSGAAIDVFPTEPKSNDEEFVSPLRQFDNVILTPHIGGSTQEAQENIGIEVAGKLAKYSDNGSTITAVNFPEVSLPELANRSRLLHVHHNRPGVLTQINQAFAQHGINIAAQYLQTDASIGYVVIDVDTDQSEVALKELSAVEGTIRARILH